MPQKGYIPEINIGVAIMTDGSIGMALFTGVFVGIVMFLVEYLIPDSSLFVRVIIAGLSALVGGFIGNKLFPNETDSK